MLLYIDISSASYFTVIPMIVSIVFIVGIIIGIVIVFRKKK